MRQARGSELSVILPFFSILEKLCSWRLEYKYFISNQKAIVNNSTNLGVFLKMTAGSVYIVFNLSKDKIIFILLFHDNTSSII